MYRDPGKRIGTKRFVERFRRRFCESVGAPRKAWINGCDTITSSARTRATTTVPPTYRHSHEVSQEERPKSAIEQS